MKCWVRLLCALSAPLISSGALRTTSYAGNAKSASVSGWLLSKPMHVSCFDVFRGILLQQCRKMWQEIQSAAQPFYQMHCALNFGWEWKNKGCQPPAPAPKPGSIGLKKPVVLKANPKPAQKASAYNPHRLEVEAPEHWGLQCQTSSSLHLLAQSVFSLNEICGTFVRDSQNRTGFAQPGTGGLGLGLGLDRSSMPPQVCKLPGSAAIAAAAKCWDAWLLRRLPLPSTCLLTGAGANRQCCSCGSSAYEDYSCMLSQ
eukprot:scaffold254282_cov21-Tisochrysis_lutea.AAC.1